MIIGLDLSLSNSGIVVINKSGKLILHHTIKTKKESDRIIRYHKFKVELFSFLSSNNLMNPNNIFAIEDYTYGIRNSRSLISLAEQGGIVRYIFYFENLVLVEYSNSSVKKFVTGKGNANKDLMLKSVYKKWGFDFNDHNLADASAVAMLCLAHQDILDRKKLLTDFLKYEQEVLKEIIKNE